MRFLKTFFALQSFIPKRLMELQPGDYVNTPLGDGYVNEVIDNEVIVDLTEGDDSRHVFEKEQLVLLPD